jgi:endo-1,4-beta-xylanase
MIMHAIIRTTFALAACAVPALAQPALKEVFRDHFLVGAALNAAQFTEQDPAQARLISRHFNAITPENVLKWEEVHPHPQQYDFTASDRYVAFGEKRGMFIIGHTLIWHNQTPAWVFQDDRGQPLGREALLARMREHISTVVGRYRGKIQGWDVVNEALKEDGSLRDSPWRKIIGDDYIQQAFEFAHTADPAAELYYNDFSLESPPKRQGAVALVRKLQAARVPIAGLGTQQHVKLDWPNLQQVDDTLATFGRLGLKVMVTELDVDVLPAPGKDRSAEVSRRAAATPALNPYRAGLPEAVQQALARRYADLFAVYCKHRGTLARVTFWGVTDRDSWLNDWPVPGRTSYPLLFDREGRPKPAFDAVGRTPPGR